MASIIPRLAHLQQVIRGIKVEMATLNDLGYPLLVSHDLEEDQAILDL